MMMHTSLILRAAPLLLLVLTLASPVALGQTVRSSFTGDWALDLRNAAERARGAECGMAAVTLIQTQDLLTGSHSMASVDCGRVNEGGMGTVHGIVVGSTAVLTVISARNGAVLLGTAKLERGSLRWTMREEVRPGDVEGDSALVLWKGLLRPNPAVEPTCSYPLPPPVRSAPDAP